MKKASLILMAAALFAAPLASLPFETAHADIPPPRPHPEPPPPHPDDDKPRAHHHHEYDDKKSGAAETSSQPSK